jgi:hypothetical protein
MSETLLIPLRITGAGLILLAILHVPIGRKLMWREQAARMSPENEAIFHVHAFFICVLLVMMGLPSLLEPSVFLEKSRAAMWVSWLVCGFWFLRLYCQWFVYGSNLWRGKRLETVMHFWFTAVWIWLVVVYGACGALQAGWLP